MNKNTDNVLGWAIVAIVAFSIFISNDSDSSSTTQYSNQSTGSYYRSPEVDENHTISRDDAISDYWDEIKDYLDGSETIEACSSTSGNCYDLEADISRGGVEK